MKKVLLMSLDVIYDLNRSPIFEDFIDCLNEIIDNGNRLAFVSHSNNRLIKAEREYGHLNDNYKFITRTKAKEIVKKHGKNYFIFLGNRDQDFFNANNNNMLFLYPTWTKEIEKKANYYGLEITNPKELLEVIKTANNQSSWYSHYQLEDGSTVLSLMDGAYSRYSKSLEEKDMIENFEKVLKDGKKNTYFDILLYHFIAAISNDNDLFKDVDVWGIFPSSTTTLNPEMLLFKKKVREMMNGREPSTNRGENNILLRHTEVAKSRLTNGNIRYNEGSDKHMDSIYINPEFKKKVKNSTVCIFDDFLNYGNSFESARNLLKVAGAKKIIFVAFGKFRAPYIYQNYDIIGDVFSEYIQFSRLNRKDINHSEFIINNKAKTEVENLHQIFNL